VRSIMFHCSSNPVLQWKEAAGAVIRPRMEITTGGGDGGMSEGGLHQVKA